ncbi:hypothetical protein BDR03DRAFT_1018401 [Suillus americanus]|nr:hypothetical protein BDR03DRAFT_1018401 [Suillus americanus]
MDTDDDHSDFEPPALTKFTGDYFQSNYDEEDFESPPGFSEKEEEYDEFGDRDRDIVAAHDAELEHGWEFPADPISLDIDSADLEDIEPRHTERQQAEAPLGQCPTIEEFPRRGAGAPLHCAGTTAFKSYKDKLPHSENLWAPFTSRIDYEVAKWAKLHGAGSMAFSDLLAIDGLHDALGLSYQNSHELNHIIDQKLPCRRPQFKHEEIIVANEAFNVYSRESWSVSKLSIQIQISCKISFMLLSVTMPTLIRPSVIYQ